MSTRRLIILPILFGLLAALVGPATATPRLPRPEAAAGAEQAPGPAAQRRSLSSFGQQAATSQQARVSAPVGVSTIYLPMLKNGSALPAESRSLLRQNFYLVSDSDGYAPAAEVEIVLAFEPNGVAQLHVADRDDMIAYRGSYSYTNGQLALKFSGADFHPDVTFALDLNATTVSMPFDVFTPDRPGPSTWRREEVSIEQNMWLIFSAATSNEQVPIAQALARARVYADALITPASKLAAGPLNSHEPVLVGTETAANGVRLLYRDSAGVITKVHVQLFGWAGVVQGNSLQTSPLAGDPRVHLDPNEGLNASGDPASKTALLVAPFYTRRILSWNPFNPASSLENEQQLFDLNAMQQKLSDNGYSVQQLSDDTVSVVNLIEALLTSPSLVMFSSHGSSDGWLLTGTYLGTEWNKDAAIAELKDQQQLLRDAGYGDLLTYSYNGEHALQIGTVRNGMTKKYQSGFIAITPTFWRWLRTRGADFSSSLVYVGACQTSGTVELRDAIRARVIIGYDADVMAGTNAAVMRYLVESLVRNTHSAEETYYNILRVIRTRQMIYKEDKLLDGYVEWGGGQGTLADHIKAHVTLGPNSTGGPDGIMAYTELGWLGAASSGTLAAGDVWWLLFAARWSQNAQTGANNLKDCWDQYWSQGSTGGLASPFCQNAAPGGAPNQDEVAYATYLLLGQSQLAFSGSSVPRWTLNDGQP